MSDNELSGSRDAGTQIRATRAIRRRLPQVSQRSLATAIHCSFVDPSSEHPNCVSGDEAVAIVPRQFAAAIKRDVSEFPDDWRAATSPYSWATIYGRIRRIDKELTAANVAA